MIRKKLLSLAAAGILTLTSLGCNWQDSQTPSYLFLQYDEYYSVDDEDLPPACSDYIYISGYYFDDTADPDNRFAIPVIRLTQMAIDNPTDTVVVSVAKCLMAIMDQMEIDQVYFMGDIVTYEQAIDMSEF